MTLEYRQRYDDPAQGLNDTKGAILKDSGSLASFGLSDMTLPALVSEGGWDDGCDCEGNGGVCGC